MDNILEMLSKLIHISLKASLYENNANYNQLSKSLRSNFINQFLKFTTCPTASKTTKKRCINKYNLTKQKN